MAEELSSPEDLGMPGIRRRGLLSALSGVTPDDLSTAMSSATRPALNSGSTGAPISHRIEDDPRQHVAAMDANASMEDLESRVGTTAAPRYQPAQPDDHEADLERQYREASQPEEQEPLSLKRKIGLGIISALGGGAGVARGLENRNARFDRQQQMRQQRSESLLSQIEAERRMNEQEEGLSQRLGVQERGENLRAQMARDQQESQNQRLIETIQGQNQRQQAGFEQQNQLENQRERLRDQMQSQQFAQQEKLEGQREANSQALEDKRLKEMMGRQDIGTKEKVLTYWQPSLDSAERVNVMSKNYQDATQNHDQQAMLSLLSNHLGMTMGLQKGARLTQSLITEAQKSQPWLQGMKAKFDKDGYLSGVTLSPQQMKQMLDLGYERYREDVKKSRSMSGYIGVKDEPPRQISPEAVDYYLDQAGGDPNRARQMSQQDGWTF